MSAFTFTAPIVTEEEEREERAALTDEERLRLNLDVYGGEQFVPETEEMLENGVVLLREALQDIPDTEKAAYLEAIEIAPLVVERESNPVAFLRCEKYDAEKAARRLVAYWDVRKKTFGAERAFLPMTQAGAMAEDMEYVEKALIVMLPDDDHDRAVFHWDRIRCIRSVAPRDSVVRCFFYLMQVLCERENAQTRGYVQIVNFRGFDLYKHFDRILSKKTNLIMNCIPSKTKAIHICTGSGKSVTELVLPVLKQMAGKELRLRFNLHAGSDNEILARLEDFGLSEEHGRAVYGGRLRSIELHQEWIGERQAIEREREDQEPERAEQEDA